MIVRPINSQLSIFPLNVGLIEPNELLLAGFSRILNNLKEVRVVHAKTSAVSMLEALRTSSVQVIVTSLESTDLDAWSLIHRLRCDFPELKVIVNGNIDPGPLLKPLLLHGACTYYINGTLNNLQLQEMLQKVLEQGFYFTPTVSKALIESLKKDHDHIILPEFSPREEDVLLSLSQGKDRLDISKILFISLSTVNFHIQNLIEKADVSSTLSLIVKANNEGWITIITMKRRYKLQA